MACRIPVIGTPAGAAPELLGFGGAVLVEYDNVVAMADAILHVTGLSEEEWREMPRMAREAAERYSWHDATLRFADALRQAVDRSRNAQYRGA